jgi:hypothetical protein
MPTARTFAYNPGAPISGTEQVGDIAVGIEPQDYSGGYGGVRWWNGPDEDLGYVICYSVPSEDHPSPDGNVAGVGFFRSELLTEESFIQIAEYVSGNQIFNNGSEAKIWLNNNGYWTSYIIIASPTPTPTNTITPTPTNTITPTPTNTTSGTPQPTPSITSSQTPTNTVTGTPTRTPTNTPTPTPTNSFGVTFTQTFTSGASPGTTIENAWTTFRSQLTGTYTKFDFFSSNGQGYTGITDSTKVQQLADSLRTGTGGINFTTTISGVTWAVGCCACRSGTASNDAVEFANIALCSAGSTAALRPFINNPNWGGIGTTVNAATQTLTLRFY